MLQPTRLETPPHRHKRASVVQPCQLRQRKFSEIRGLTSRLSPTIKMAEEKKTPITAGEAPPSYDNAAIEHGELPTRTGPPPGKPGPRPLFPLDIPVLNQLRGKRVILASQSPRRKQILSMVRTVPNPTMLPTF
jgi:hypothetical protein